MIIISNKKVARIVNLQMDSANWTGNLAHLHPRSIRLQTCKSSYTLVDTLKDTELMIALSLMTTTNYASHNHLE